MPTDNIARANRHQQQQVTSYSSFDANLSSVNNSNPILGACQFTTNHALNCLRVTEHSNPTSGAALWLAPGNLSGPTPVPLPHPDFCQHGERERFIVTSHGGDSSNVFVGCYPQQDQVAYKVSKAPIFVNQAGLGSVSMQPPTQPLITHQIHPISEQAIRRQAYYRQRHHPQQILSLGFTNEELKNKNRFSATGVCGDSTVVRDTKMSLSSAPSSPTAGSVGGSLGSSGGRVAHPIIFPVSSAIYCGNQPSVFSSSKKVSDMSTSSTLSSYSSSSLSSSSSINGVSPRKRRADEDSGTHQDCRMSSTSEVTAGVNGVRLCDSSSKMSLEGPTEQHQHKRSKNDNCEDDDVVFVSAEPAPKLPQQRLGEVVMGKQNPFASNPPPQPVKSVRRSKKGSTKRSGRPVKVVSLSPVPQQHPTPSSFTTSEFTTPLAKPSVSNTGERYFLRSSAKRNGVDENNNQNGQAPSSSDHQVATTSHPVRYHTRSQQRRKQDNAGTSDVTIASQQQQSPVAPSNSSTQWKKVENVQQKLSAPTSVIRTAPPLLQDPQQKSSSVFKKIYDIRGIIGVGGGGTVYAGTRKSDNVQVAIKQVPKAKVKRWGKLDGRVVPIEFELLYRAAESGNDGVIGMIDWYERRNSYILIMERPQPVIDLFDYLNQHGALPENIAKNIFRQLVKAVIHCHDNGVVHRDIKDENVLLNLHTSEAKLIDFGCGTIMKDAPYTEFAGTPEFYPPEWFIERKYTGRRVDAWSLGVLLYTMVEAEVPFQKEKDIIACELRHKRAQTTTSEACRHLIATMLQKDEKKRLTLDQVLNHPWLTNQSGSTGSLQQSVPAGSSNRPQPNGVMHTNELYVPTSPNFTPQSPLSPLKLQRQLAADPYSPPIYSSRIVGTQHGVNQGSPVPLQASECIVRS